MRKFWALILSCVFSCFSPCFSKPIPQDVISTFLTEYTDGKPTGTIIQLEINILKPDKKTKWVLKQVTFSSSDIERNTNVQMMQTSSEENTDAPYLNKINWEPSRSFECSYLPDGWHKIKFEAKKVSGTKNVWDVICKGEIKLTGSSSSVPWEWKSSKEIDLKYSKIKLVNLYLR